MFNELVTVIITTYKRPYKMLYRAIESVLNQSYKKIELIIVDDSPSEYEERENIKKNINFIEDDRIKYIQHEANRGGCAARNTGIKNSNGKLIAFLDDDDEWIEYKLEKQIKYMFQNNVDLVYCAWQDYIDKDNKKNIKGKVHTQLFKENNIYNLLKCNYIGSTSFVLTKRNCFVKCGMFNEKLRSCQDWEMWLRISKYFKIGCVNEVLVKYHIHSSERITSNAKNRIQGHEFILKEYYEYIYKNPEILRINLQRLAKFYADDRKYMKSIKMWRMATVLKPFSFRDNLISLLKIGIRIRLN